MSRTRAEPLRPEWVALHLPPDAFAAVMATGTVSIAARDHAYPRIDLPLTTLAAATLVLLVAASAARLLAGPTAAWKRAADPDMALRLFSFVAACTVLGVRFAAHPAALWSLAGVAITAWLMLVPLAVWDVRSQSWARLRTRVHGGWLLPSVATAGLAITFADLAAHSRWPGWLVLSAAAWILAVLLYLSITWLIARRATTTPFVPEEVTPDSWILMGALGITALAGTHMLAALRAQGSSPWLTDATRSGIIVLWALASLWIPILLYAEMWRADHRTGSVKFVAAWWSAVFPLGMYSAATQAVALHLHMRSLITISLVFFWIAFSIWVLVAVGWLHTLARAAHDRPR